MAAYMPRHLTLLLLLLQAFLTNTWACPGKVPEDAPVCIDSWTGVKVCCPVIGRLTTEQQVLCCLLSRLLGCVLAFLA
jgi:hypothetical protein